MEREENKLKAIELQQEDAMGPRALTENNNKIDDMLVVYNTLKPQDKILKDPKPVLNIGTHNGVFHTDEVIAIALIKIFRSDVEINIVRTRDTIALSKCDILVDVGGIYDGVNKFDHHQWDEKNCHYGKSSAGLVYDKMVESGWTKKLSSFIEHVDARDTRSYRDTYMTWDFITNSLKEVKVPKYNEYSAHNQLCNYIARCNTLNPMNAEEQDRMFNTVVEHSRNYLLDMLDIVDSVWEDKTMDYSSITELAERNDKEKKAEFALRAESVVTDGLVTYGEWYPQWSKDLTDGVFVCNGDRDGEFKVMVDTTYLKIISSTDEVFTHAGGFISIIKPTFFSECMITVKEENNLVDIHFDMNYLINKQKGLNYV